MTKLILETFLPYRMNRLAASISQEFRSVYGRYHDLTVPEWRVLATLGEYETMGAKAIGAHSSMHKTKVSRAVRALEERRWLVRETHPTDRREEVLRLTVRGRAVYGEIVPKALAFERKMIDTLGVEIDGFFSGLRNLEMGLGAAGEEASNEKPVASPPQ